MSILCIKPLNAGICNSWPFYFLSRMYVIFPLIVHYAHYFSLSNLPWTNYSKGLGVKVIRYRHERLWPSLRGTGSSLITFSAPGFLFFDGQQSWGNALFSFSVGCRAFLCSCLSAFDTLLIQSFYLHTLLYQMRIYCNFFKVREASTLI